MLLRVVCSAMRVAKLQPNTGQNLLHAIGPGILSSIVVGVWRKAPEAFPDSNTTVDNIFQKPGDHPNSRKNALGVKRPFSELSESSGVFSEQLSELEIPFSEYEIPFSEWPLAT